MAWSRTRDKTITCTKCHKYPPRSLLPYGFTQQPRENDYLHQMSQIPSKISAALWLHTTTAGEWLPAPNVTNTLQDLCCPMASHNNPRRMITCTKCHKYPPRSLLPYGFTQQPRENDYLHQMSQIPSKISAALWLHTTTAGEWLPAPNVTNTLQDLCCPMASHNNRGRMITCTKCHKYPPRSLLPYGFTHQPRENDYLHQMSQIPSKISAALWLHTTTPVEWLPAPCHKYPPRSLLPYGFTQQP